MKDLLIVVTTWLPPGGEQERLDAFHKALRSWETHIRFDGNIRIHIADDGTVGGEWIRQLLPAWAQWTITLSQNMRCGVGASLNRGMVEAKDDEIVAYFVDDWQLLQTLDLTPWVKAFDEVNRLGFVRLGPPHPGCTGVIQPLPNSEREWLLYLNHHNFAFSFRPMLLNPGMWLQLDIFPEGESSLECERLYNDRFCRSLWEGALALHHPFDHIYTQVMSEMRPGEAVVR